MKVKISELLRIINQEADKEFKKIFEQLKKQDEFISCENFNVNDLIKRRQEIEAAFGSFNIKSSSSRGLGDELLRVVNDPAYQAARNVGRTLNELKKAVNAFVNTTPTKEKCEVITAVLNNSKVSGDYATAMQDLKAQLEDAGRAVSSIPSWAEAVYYELRDATASLQHFDPKAPRADATVVDDEAVEEIKKEAIELIGNIEYNKFVSILPIKSFLVAGDSNIGCARAWNNIVSDFTIEGVGALLGASASAFAIRGLHKTAASKAAEGIAGWASDSRTYASTFDRIKANRKLRLSRVGLASLIYIGVQSILIDSPQVERGQYNEKKNELESTRAEMIAAQKALKKNPGLAVRIEKLKRKAAKLDKELNHSKKKAYNKITELGHGTLIGAQCAVALYQSFLSGAAVTRFLFQSDEISRSLAKSATKDALNEGVKDAILSLKREAADLAADDFSLAWGLTATNKSILGKRLFGEEAGKVTFNSKEFDALIQKIRTEARDPNSEIASRLSEELGELGIKDPNIRKNLVSRLLDGDSSIGVNLEQFTIILNAHAQKHMVSLLGLVRQLSSQAAKKSSLWVPNNILTVLRESTEKINVLNKELDDLVNDLGTEAQLMRSAQGKQAAESITDQFGASGPTQGVRINVQSITDLEDKAAVLAAYGRGSFGHRLTKGGVYSLEASPDASTSFIKGKYGKLQLYIERQLADLDALKKEIDNVSADSPLVGIKTNREAARQLKEYETALINLKKKLKSVSNVVQASVKRPLAFRGAKAKAKLFDQAYVKILNNDVEVAFPGQAGPVIIRVSDDMSDLDLARQVVDKLGQREFPDVAYTSGGDPIFTFSDEISDTIFRSLQKIRDVKQSVNHAAGINGSRGPIEFIDASELERMMREGLNKKVKKINLNVILS